MTATSVETIQHLDWAPSGPCEYSQCQTGHSATWILLGKCPDGCVVDKPLCGPCAIYFRMIMSDPDHEWLCRRCQRIFRCLGNQYMRIEPLP